MVDPGSNQQFNPNTMSFLVFFGLQVEDKKKMIIDRCSLGFSSFIFIFFSVFCVLITMWCVNEHVLYSIE
jgi:hypothetical protein